LEQRRDNPVKGMKLRGGVEYPSGSKPVAAYIVETVPCWTLVPSEENADTLKTIATSFYFTYTFFLGVNA